MTQHAGRVEILIVDDDADLVETYTDLLEDRGYAVIGASNIKDATQQLVKRQPRLITLDLHLPGNSTSDMISFIDRARTLNNPKIIVISGHPEMVAGVDWMELADMVMTKPVENLVLTRMVDRLLSS